ncbi:YfhO family protein [Hoylesella timonensis]|uniref:Membrane protein n=1 Tax=Hoylesella timonensis S9-PR14 TaxID=1401062 RepID=A0A098YW57_9BACT|nr:YfhO family protein [Hoylesella timonensis]KGI22823.1 membrane protein [Hoylesella timonensis S9-PR14]
MEVWKKYGLDVAAVVLFVLISFAYFVPASLDGRILFQHDASAGRGMGHEQQTYFERTGERTRWTNSVFGGMPTYQTAPSYKSTDALSKVMDAYHLWLPENVWYVFAYLLGFYILLRAFDFRQELAVLGSIIWAFSSYFFIIIAAGHIWKVMALAYLPPMIAGLVLAYRGKYLWGFILTALFTAFEVKANHVQMTYYYLFVVLFMVIAYLVQAIKNKQLLHFGKATAVCAAAACLGICMNLSNLYHTWEYSKESMRGKSELVKANTANQTNSGLERDYITQWSYGIGETWTLLIPNAKGGASVPLSQNETAMKKADPNFIQIYQQMGQYWGEQPGTSGPVYVGAFVLMLFILALFIVKGPMKWALLAATVLSVLLSWGKNFMPLTNFFIDYMPMYAKFRTVASILVIAEFTIPLLAMLGLKKILDTPSILNKQIKYVYISFGLTAGFCLLFALMPSVFFSNFVSAQELEAMKSIPAEYQGQLIANLREMRQAIFTDDCWRSFFIIVIGTFLLLLYRANKLKKSAFVGLVIVLCLVDMWQVNKRYLNDGMFVEKSVRDNPIEMTPTDQQILQTKELDYRVLNLATSTFNENETSYFHKSIGGYHPAKLRRYQEMIETYIAPEMEKLMKSIVEAQGDMTKLNGDSISPVLNMLNTKFFIMPLQGGQTVPLKNPYAFGNAWFVDKVTYVNNANEELEMVGKLNLRAEAVADKKFRDVLGSSCEQDHHAQVTMKNYEPNQLTYEVESAKGGVLVFSENYYPEWTATVDGKEVPVGRVNYILRAIQVKPGKHQVVLSFFPKSVDRTETVAYIAFALLVICILLGIGLEIRQRKTGATAQDRK